MRDLGILWAMHWYRNGSENIPSKSSDTINIYPPARIAEAIDHSPRKALAGLKSIERPGRPDTEIPPAFGIAIAGLRANDTCPRNMAHRQLENLGDVVEAGPSKSVRSINPSLGFPSMKTVYRTLKGFKVTSALSNDQTIIWRYGDSAMGEECPIDGQLGIYAV